MTDTRTKVASLLIDVECDLRKLDAWSSMPPTEEQLASTQPFCIDTLTFVEWVQFVFVARMRELLDNELPLPQKCGIAPMAEEYFRGLSVDGSGLVDTLNKMDDVLSGDH